ncbi:hypothetical protein At1g04090-like [Malania oleifera]|uniref:hypothetical protein At1g04090-like n=1 Tax=Malania oleifera TaxID=397392 RepID=UPI0025AE2AA0|nr:hypothetical protein At1g04090-like [Malania oleifera]
MAFSALILLLPLLLWSRLSFKSSTLMVNCLTDHQIFKNQKALPIDTPFQLPSPLPQWPSGIGFANGIIDLGEGLLVRQISSFTKVWNIREGGDDNLGASFFEPPPTPAPDGFFMLGSYAQPNNKPLFGSLLVAKDSTTSSAAPALRPPLDYTLLWSSTSSRLKTDGPGFFWTPMPPAGYIPLGVVVTTSPQKPPLDKVRCVRANLTDTAETDNVIWGQGSAVNLFSLRPRLRGTQAPGLAIGTFIANLSNNPATSIACLKNTNPNRFSAMPNLNQIKALLQVYSPLVHFHSKEQYLPSSVSWFFTNGALLYTRGRELNPDRVDPTGANLPLGGSNDGAYWLDLPVDGAVKEMVKKGNLQSFEAYVHVKPVNGGSVTDLAMWLFYPFNGPGKVRIEKFDVELGRAGEHVGDWEQVTLRVSNFNGQLQSVFFSQHNKGMKVSAPELEFENGNKVAVYASLDGHASYPHPGVVLLGSKLKVGVKNETDGGGSTVDTGAKYAVIAADYLGTTVVSPPWVNYMRKWGPKITYDIWDEINRAVKWLPKFLRNKLLDFLKKLPRELLEQDGPTGPKEKSSWDGDEF